MKEIVRKPKETPDCLLVLVSDDARKKNLKLITTQEKYTQSWIESVNRLKNNKIKTITFAWHDLHKDLRPLLLAMTNNHCSFCDRKFDDDEIENSIEIEHFKPKIKFPEASYSWNNLFIICRACNKAKNDEFKVELLKPDSKNYKFDDYFSFDYKTGELIINCENDKSIAAQETIKIFDLNRAGLCSSRIKVLKFINKLQNQDIEIDISDFSYRNYLEIALNDD